MESTIKNILEKLKDKKLSPTNFSSDNILYLLGIHYNEVVICRLIKAIIEPNGFHGLGDIPFKLFMQNVLGVNKFEIKQPEIILEEKITDNRRVDIAIYNNGYVYPIEVKIWAKDQYLQLNDYYHYYINKPDKTTIEKIYYLTPDGHKPSPDSQGKLEDEKIKTISFGDEITKYLSEVLTHTKNDDCKNIINNLIEVIDVMASSNKNATIFKSLFNELNDQDKNNLLALLNQKEILWEYIRNQYLTNSIESYSEKSNRNIEIAIVKDENVDTIDKKCVFILKYDTQKIAYLCIDKNIYIARNKLSFEEGTFIGEWTWKDHTYDYNSDFAWHYIYNEGSKKEWNLKDVDEELFNKTIDWGKYL